MLRAVAVLCVLAGCDVGEVPVGGGSNNPTVDAPPGEDPANKASFDTVMKPMVMAKGCLNGAICHMVSPPQLAEYSSVAAKYKVKPGNANILVTKGDHQNTIYFDQAQKDAVAAWIDGLK